MPLHSLLPLRRASLAWLLQRLRQGRQRLALILSPAMLVVALLVTVLGGLVARAAISVGSVSSAQGNVSQLTFSHTVPSGSNRLLAVAVSQQDPLTNWVQDVTYGGVALTPLRRCMASAPVKLPRF